MQLTGRRYDTGEAVTVDVADGKIAAIQPAADGRDLPWIAPAFIDVQFNGWAGIIFSSGQLTTDGVAKVTSFLDAQGVAKYCPTVTTNSFEVLCHAMKTIVATCDGSRDVTRRVCGIHMEGPYLSSEEGPRGAQPIEHMRAPDWDEFQRIQACADGRIIILTLSPEYEGSAEFIKKASDSGVVIAIGHTSANSDQIRAAVDAGAKLSTHLGNGAHGQIRRHPNYIWDQLAEDRLVASIITDGHHLPPSVIRSFVRGKTPDRVILVSDASSLAGLPPGVYGDGMVESEILEDGRIVIAGQRQLLAGASLPIGVCVANVVRYSDVDLERACNMASRQPLQLIGQSPVELAEGNVASLVQFALPTADDGTLGDLAVLQTVVEGDIVYEAAGTAT